MAEKTQANPDKLKVLNAVMEKIEKDFGKGSIMRMSSAEVAAVQVIPTGSITLDMALGVGGYPKGRVIEIYGPESSGKTTLAIHAIAEAQKAGGIAAFVASPSCLTADAAQIRRSLRRRCGLIAPPRRLRSGDFTNRRPKPALAVRQ